MKILIFDADVERAKGLRYHLQQAGYHVLLAFDTPAFDDLVGREMPDLVIVDSKEIEIGGDRPFANTGARSRSPLVLPLPFADGRGTAISGSSPGDGERVLDAQRQTAEVILRRLQRLRRGSATRVRVGGVAMDFDQRNATFHGESLALTPLQFKLLGVLALNAKRVVAYRDLLEQVWGYEGDDEEARELLKVHINRIRQRMRAAAPSAELPIHAVRGFGYMLVSPKTSA